MSRYGFSSALFLHLELCCAACAWLASSSVVLHTPIACGGCTASIWGSQNRPPPRGAALFASPFIDTNLLTPIGRHWAVLTGFLPFNLFPFFTNAHRISGKTTFARYLNALNSGVRQLSKPEYLQDVYKGERDHGTSKYFLSRLPNFFVVSHNSMQLQRHYPTFIECGR